MSNMNRIIPVVIGAPLSQRDRVDRLVQYCKELDGTIVKVIPVDDSTFQAQFTNNEFGCRQAHALRTVANQINGPFIWLEADSVPLKPMWANELRAEYKRGGKEFMLSSDSHPPHDLIGGIGIYGANTRWLVPNQFPRAGWDGWMLQHLSPVIHFSPIIQHSYGIYPSNVLGTQCNPHLFPRDAKMIRDNAVIFHRDRFQGLIPNTTLPAEVPVTAPTQSAGPVVMRHSGDIGDIIAALPILRAQGGGKMVLFFDKDAPKGMCARESLKGKRFEMLKPLLEVQPYVHGVEWNDDISIGREESFRETARPKYESLLERQANHVGQVVDTSPWLVVPNVQQHNRIICARSPRYHNPFGFPWREVGETYRDQLLFIGLPDEHKAFEEVMGRKVERADTPNFLEIARLIAGAPQFMGNQSSPLWVAMGLGVKVICEGCPDHPNSEIPRMGSSWAYTPEDMQMLRASLEMIAANRAR